MGAVVAMDEATAQMLYQATVRAGYATAMVTEEPVRTAVAPFQRSAEMGGSTDLVMGQAVAVPYRGAI